MRILNRFRVPNAVRQRWGLLLPLLPPHARGYFRRVLSLAELADARAAQGHVTDAERLWFVMAIFGVMHRVQRDPKFEIPRESPNAALVADINREVEQLIRQIAWGVQFTENHTPEA